MLSLIHIFPSAPFACVRWITRKCDRQGSFKAGGEHRYSAGPANASREVAVAMGAFDVTVVGLMWQHLLEQIYERIRPASLNSTGLMSVSYTHLDVYKRQVIHTSKIRRCPGDMETSGHTGLASLTIPTSKQIKRERKAPHAKSTYRCSTRSRISSVRPWFQNCVPM